MAKIGDFDANQHEPQESFDPMPPGWYAMQCISSEVRKTKDGAGQYLWLEFEILESMHPELKGRRAWDRLNIWNANQQAVDIANRTLSTICRSVGVMKVEDSEVLHHKPIAVKLKVTPAGEYEARNEISGYDAIQSRFQTGAPVSSTTQTSPGGQPPAGSTAPGSTAPWAK